MATTTNFDAISVTGSGSVAGSNSISAAVQPPQSVFSADGTITLQNGSFSVVITKTSAAAITLPPPTAGAPGTGNDGIEVTIFSETAFAHVITCSQGFNRKGSSGTATASAAANNYIRVQARNGQWNVVGNVNFTLA